VLTTRFVLFNILIKNTKCAVAEVMKGLNKEKIAEILVTLRGDRSREEVAKALEISVSALQMYENAKRVPKDEIKLKIANYYGVSVESIFFNH
jgi:putative transcriptional regulator